MYVSNYYMNWVGTHVVNDIRHDLFSKIIHFPVSFYQKKTSGELLSYFLNDIGAVQNASSNAIRNGVRTFFETVFLISVACKQNPQITILLLTVGPIVALTISKMGKRMQITARKSQEAMGSISSLLQEMFIGIREIKSFNTETTEVNRFSSYLNHFFSSIMRNVRVVSITPAFIETMTMTGCGIIFYIASRQVISGTMTPGQLASFAAATILAYQPIKRMISVYSDVQTGIASAGRVFEIMDLTHIANENRTLNLESFNKKIEFKNFAFSYDDSHTIFQNIDLTISKGESVGIIGVSGTGKSTFADLILGFVQGQPNTLFIDGKDITQISFDSLRRRIGYVGQRTFLFNDTILANILYSSPDAIEEEIIEACKTAHAHEFIVNLPNGYNTVVGENGCLLSGGQKQRLTIARALLKKPEILIFDEATSALDQKSEEIICEALEDITKNKTVIMISHRMSLIKKMNRVLTIQNKQLIELPNGQYKETELR